MSYQPLPHPDPPPQPGNLGTNENALAVLVAKDESSHRLGILGIICGSVSLGLFAGPWIIFALLGLSLAIADSISTVGSFIGLPLSIVGMVLSALGFRSVSYKQTAVLGLVFSIIAFVLTLVIVIVTILPSK